MVLQESLRAGVRVTGQYAWRLLNVSLVRRLKLLDLTITHYHKYLALVNAPRAIVTIMCMKSTRNTMMLFHWRITRQEKH